MKTKIYILSLLGGLLLTMVACLNDGKDDYLDFNKLTGQNWRRELLEYILGYSEKGYLDMCRYCHGADCYNYLIPAAQQL